MKRPFVVAVVVLMAALFIAGFLVKRRGIRASTPEVRTSGEWTYVRIPTIDSAGNRRHEVSTFVLRWKGQDVKVRGRLVTPFGDLYHAAPVDASSNRGWIQVGEATSSKTPVTGQSLSSGELGDGFYDWSEKTRRPLTPANWVYWYDLARPVWVRPDLLLSRTFTLPREKELATPNTTSGSTTTTGKAN